MDVFGKLFGSEDRVKILRLFLFNPEQAFSVDDIAGRAKSSLPVVRHEVGLLKKARLVKGKRFTKLVQKKIGKGKKEIVVRKKEGGWILDPEFPHLEPLEHLLIKTVFLKNEELLRRLAPIGKLKLVVIAGVFTQDRDSRVDLLIVGDSLRKQAIQNIMKTIESEVGKELRYSAFETSEFEYRLGMYDKLIRDILDYPHKKILDRIGISDRPL